MRLGIDFDNTIVSYHKVFHQVALESELIPEDLPVSKLAVRDYLRRAGKEDAWTEMQGYVYGARMDDAVPYPGVIEFLSRARDAGMEMAIISHKTRHPFIGPQYDLHEAARTWVARHLKDKNGPFITQDHVYFELTKAEKLQRITGFNCDYYIDDLPEILEAEEFPENTRGILFDPDKHHEANNRWLRVSAWEELGKLFER